MAHVCMRFVLCEEKTTNKISKPPCSPPPAPPHNRFHPISGGPGVLDAQRVYSSLMSSAKRSIPPSIGTSADFDSSSSAFLLPKKDKKMLYPICFGLEGNCRRLRFAGCRCFGR